MYVLLVKTEMDETQRSHWNIPGLDSVVVVAYHPLGVIQQSTKLEYGQEPAVVAAELLQRSFLQLLGDPHTVAQDVVRHVIPKKIKNSLLVAVVLSLDVLSQQDVETVEQSLTKFEMSLKMAQEEAVTVDWSLRSLQPTVPSPGWEMNTFQDYLESIADEDITSKSQFMNFPPELILEDVTFLERGHAEWTETGPTSKPLSFLKWAGEKILQCSKEAQSGVLCSTRKITFREE